MAARISSQDASGTSSGASVSATYAATPTKGNVLVAGVFCNKPKATASISGWTLLGANECTAQTSALSGGVWYKVADGTESTTVTATATGANVMRIFITEYSGIATGHVESANLSGFRDNVAAATSSTEQGGTAWSSTAGNGPNLVISLIIWGVGTSAPSYNDGTVIYSNNRMSMAEDFDTTHTSHVTLGAHIGTWSWTTSAGSGLLVATFDLEEPTLTTLGVGPQ